MRGGLTGLLILMVVGGWLITLLVGSLIALRGKKSWATILLVIGSSGMCLGGLGYVGGVTVLFSNLYRSSGTYRGGGMELFTVLMVASLVALGVGLLLFTAGFLGVAGRYGMAERRAEQLEQLVQQLQQRIQGGM